MDAIKRPSNALLHCKGQNLSRTAPVQAVAAAAVAIAMDHRKRPCWPGGVVKPDLFGLEPHIPVSPRPQTHPVVQDDGPRVCISSGRGVHGSVAVTKNAVKTLYANTLPSPRSSGTRAQQFSQIAAAFSASTSLSSAPRSYVPPHDTTPEVGRGRT